MARNPLLDVFKKGQKKLIDVFRDVKPKKEEPKPEPKFQPPPEPKETFKTTTPAVAIGRTKAFGLIDLAKEIPQSTKTVVTALAKFAKGIQEDIARSGAAIGLTLTYPFTKRYELSQEELGKEQREDFALLFGENPIKSLQTRIAEARLKTKAFGERTGIAAIEKGALPLSILGVGAVVGLDFTGFGKADDAIKALAKATKLDVVTDILRRINVADDLIDDAAKAIVKLKKVDDVTKVIDRVSDIQKTTKKVVGRGAKEVVEEAGEKVIKEAAPKTRKFLTSVEKARPDIPLGVGGQYIPRSTDELAIKAKNLIADNIDEAEQLVRTGTDERAVATAAELIKHYGDEATKATSKASKNAFYDQAADVAHIAAENLTEQGRSVQAASIMGRLTPEGMLRFAGREINKYNEAVTKSKGLFGLRKKIPQLTAGQTESILREMTKIGKMADGPAKAMAFKKMNDAIADLVPSSMYQKIITVWKAGLLTGIKTSGLNTFSNLFHGVSETIKEVPTAVIDSVIALKTGKRTTAVTGRGSLEGLKEGFKKGWQYLRTGFDERNVGAKLDWKRINFGKSKLAKGIQKYEETIFHIMGAEDQPWYYGAKAKSIASQAIAKAKNAGKKGKEASAFIDDLIKNPTDDILRYAMNDAEIAVFQNQTTLGKIAKAVQKAPGGEVIVPFGRTPSAVANQLINYSPVGIVKAVIENVGKGNFDQRLFSQAIGRGITGSGVMAIGAALFKNELINLDYPAGERERELWKIEGRKTNSIKIAGKWRDVNVLGPAGMVLVAGAYYQKTLEETGSPFKGLVAATVGGAKSLTEQTFLRGINQVVQALNEPERSFEGWFANTAASVVPTLVSDVARTIDPKERIAPGILGRIKKRVPGLRQTLQPQVDVLGEQRARAAGRIETMIDPSRPTTIIAGPVAQELRRLFDEGYKVTPTLLGDRGGYEGLSPEENTALLEKVGELTNKKLISLFNLQQYKDIDDEDKAKLVDTVIDKAKIVARAQAIMELTDGLAGQELKDKLSQLKASRLMTNEVFKKFLELQ